MRITVIDDNEPHLKMCRILLENMGCEVSTIASLKELKETVKDIEVPDMMLIDYRLNLGETGVDVLEFVKGQSLWRDVRCIALTADVGERSMLEQSGFDLVVFKPITETMLKELID